MEETMQCKEPQTTQEETEVSSDAAGTGVDSSILQ